MQLVKRVAFFLLLTLTPSLTLAQVDYAPAVNQPSQSGDIVGVILQNTSASTENAGYVTFGEVFKQGAVAKTDSLVARINGVSTPVQMDVKATNTDGSVRHAILTFLAPQIAANASVQVMLAKGSATLPSQTAPTPATLISRGYNVSTTLSFLTPNTNTATANAATVLQGTASPEVWLSGPLVNEWRVTTGVNNCTSSSPYDCLLRITFDIRAYADGTTHTDVIYDNSWMFRSGKSDLKYNVTISQNNTQNFSYNNINHYLYSVWHHEVDSSGIVTPNIQFDVPYLISTGAVQNYDASIGISDSNIQQDYNALTSPKQTVVGSIGPMGTAELSTDMGATGGRPDIGPLPTWHVRWLLSQSATARFVMMANADASAGVPWHFTDEKTGGPINGMTYADFVQNPWGVGLTVVPANGWPQYSPAGGQLSADGDPWIPDIAHMPDMNYVPYLITGSHYRLDLLQGEANYGITANRQRNQLDASGVVPLGFTNPYQYQTRGTAWSLRSVAETSYITPDADALKSYFLSELGTAMTGFVQEYITDNINGKNGQINGFVAGYTGPNQGGIEGNQENFVVFALVELARMNMAQVSNQAAQMLQYMSNFTAGLFTNGSNGFNPLNGAISWMNIYDSSGNPFTSWSQFYSANVALGTIPANPTNFPYDISDIDQGEPYVAQAALSGMVSVTGLSQVQQAYNYVVNQNLVNMGGSAGITAAYQQDPKLAIRPFTANAISPSAVPPPPPPPPPPPSGTLSPDGSTLFASAGTGSLTTAAGTWTFSTLTAPGGNEILLNGDWASGGGAIELEVANAGQLYALNNVNNWYVWNNGWTLTSAPVVSSSPASPPPPLPTVTLSANPTSITSGQSSTLSWSSTNATSCTGTGFAASATTGSVTVTPTQTTTYSISCTGAGETASANATVTLSSITTSSFGIGVKVMTTANLNVRAKANTKSGKILCTQPSGSTGTISGGPATNQGYTWWNVNYDTGCDGWSVQNYLTASIAEAPTAPTMAASSDNLAQTASMMVGIQSVLNQLLQMLNH